VNIVGFFGGAAQLYRRNVGWLLVAGLIAGALSTAVIYISTAIVGAGSAATLGAAGGSRLAVTGMLGGAAAGLVIGSLVAGFLTVILGGGLMKMAIDSGRSGQAAQLSDLFAGFRHVPSYLGLGLIMVLGVPLAWAVLNAIVARLLGPMMLLSYPVGSLFMVWLYVSWVYAVPLVADRGLGPIAALVRSREMVARVGWWTTFLLLVLLFVALVAITALLASIAGHAGSAGAGLVGLMQLLLMPFIVCYLACMYLGSESSKATAPVYHAPGPDYGAYGDWSSYDAPPAPTDGWSSYDAPPAPSTGGYGPPPAPTMAGYGPPPAPAMGGYRAPPAPTMGGYEAPNYASAYVQPPAPVAPAPLDRAAEAAAWASAADPLAAPAPAPAPAPAGPQGAPAQPERAREPSRFPQDQAPPPPPEAPHPRWLSE